MRMSLRLILSLVLTVTLISVLFALYQVRADTHSRESDLEKRAQVLAESLQETVEPLWMKGPLWKPSPNRGAFWQSRATGRYRDL